MFNGLSRLFRSVSRRAQKYFEFTKKLLAVVVAVLVVVAIITGLIVAFTPLEATSLLFPSMTGFLGSVQIWTLWVAAAAGLLLGWALFPEQMAWALRMAFEALRYVATKSVELVADVVSVAGRALASSPLGLLLLGGGALYLLSNLRKPSPGNVSVSLRPDDGYAYQGSGRS